MLPFGVPSWMTTSKAENGSVFDLDRKNQLLAFVRGKDECFSCKKHLYQTAGLFKRKVISACRMSRAIKFLLKVLLGRVRWLKKILRENNNIIMQLPF